ncbi:YdcF family protein [Mucilaginibacter myungsuensis]|uniref:YdcF family protein n=1 Tax=Mucilaginibacter myungsuensis TaxID=649104 RepID=A0A929PVC5_9SPHI|nr:YdcF family protein [Mucilaginibacter myungsuensis]MBE9660861.1 YdcF family protein [Mucilaginibacter myungsuensis]MDN3600908.1 YdcF family protein [Mucilaginibacter myungsuensis]
MYFILSKLLLFLINPIYWILVLLLIAAFTKRAKLRRCTAIAGAVMLLLFSNAWLFNIVARSWEYRAVKLPDSARYSCAIVLGGFVSTSDGKEGHFNESFDRFFQGVKLYRAGKASHVLVTGGSSLLLPNGFSEGEWTRGQMKRFGVPDSAVLIEGKARNTMENAKLSAVVLQQKGLKPPYLLVTSANHMRRSVMIFKKNNIDVQPYPSNIQTVKIGWPVFSDIIPEPYIIMAWGGFLKELIGYGVNRFMK